MTADPLAWRMDDGLREVPVDAAAFAAAVERLTDDIASARSQPRELLGMLGRAATLLRVAGRLDEAQRAASAAVALADLLGDRRTAIENQLRLAQAMHRQGRHALSTPLFEIIVSEARAVPELADLLDAALHAAGLDLLDQGKAEQAARCLREALALRRAKSDAEGERQIAAALAAASKEAGPFVERRS